MVSRLRRRVFYFLTIASKDRRGWLEMVLSGANFFLLFSVIHKPNHSRHPTYLTTCICLLETLIGGKTSRALGRTASRNRF